MVATLLLIWVAIAAAVNVLPTDKCASGDDSTCERHWPGARCVDGICVCSPTQLKRDTKSGWVCLSLFDASTGSLGPAFTCPLPSGSGFKVAARNSTHAQFCSTQHNRCPSDYECIEMLNFIPSVLETGIDGVCCPTKRLACSQPAFSGPNPTHTRWYFDGERCVEFKWDQLAIEGQTANNFETQQHCEFYCRSK